MLDKNTEGGTKNLETVHPERLRQIRTTNFALWALGFLALVYAGEFLRRGSITAGFVILASAFLVAFGLYDLRKTSQVTRPAHLAMCAMWIGLTFAAADMGGFSGPVKNWYLVIPLFAGTLAGLRAALWWSLPATLGLGGFWWAHSSGHPFVYSIPVEARTNFELFQILGLLFAVSFLTVLILREYMRTEDNLIDSRNLLEERVQERTAELRSKNLELVESSYELVASQAQLIHSSRLAAIGQLAAGVAHELNQPLSGILIHTERLHRKTTDETIQNYCEIVTDQTERMATIVKQLLDLSRQRSHHKEIVSLPDAISKTRVLLDCQLRTAKIDLHLEFPEELPSVSADEAEVQQIILNLISNSIHSIQEVASSGNIHIAAEHIEGKVRLRITDSGSPISAEIESKLFDPFFTTKQQTQGTGLGLSISHGLMQSFGGELRFQRNQVGEKEFVLEFETP